MYAASPLNTDGKWKWNAVRLELPSLSLGGILCRSPTQAPSSAFSCSRSKTKNKNGSLAFPFAATSALIVITCQLTLSFADSDNDFQIHFCILMPKLKSFVPTLKTFCLVWFEERREKLKVCYALPARAGKSLFLSQQRYKARCIHYNEVTYYVCVAHQCENRDTLSQGWP